MSLVIAVKELKVWSNKEIKLLAQFKGRGKKKLVNQYNNAFQAKLTELAEQFKVERSKVIVIYLHCNG